MHNYREEKVLGNGQFWNVALCTDTSSGKKVVIKALSNEVDLRQLDSFRKEVAIMRLLNHPNIARYIDSFEDNGNSMLSWSMQMEEIFKIFWRMDQWMSWLV